MKCALCAHELQSFVPVTNRARPDAGEVGTRIRFAHADGKIGLAPRDARKHVAALFLGAKFQQQRTALAICDPVGCNRRAGCKQLLDNDVALECGSLVTAIGLRPCQPDQSARTKALAEFRAEAAP
jgi:hypothetical protein